MKTKEELKRELLESISVLINEKEEDIIHDYGSMDAFLDILTGEVEKLRDLYTDSYKLSSKEEELLKTVTK